MWISDLGQEGTQSPKLHPLFRVHLSSFLPSKVNNQVFYLLQLKTFSFFQGEQRVTMLTNRGCDLKSKEVGVNFDVAKIYQVGDLHSFCVASVIDCCSGSNVLCAS